MSKKITISCEIEVFDSEKELNEQDKNLLLAAKQIMDNAYAPYSNFFVGAAVLLENGKIITGSNQENAAYPSGLCAERVAIFHASSQYPEQTIKAIAVVAKSGVQILNKPVTPCGSCRQVIAEYETKFSAPIRIIMSGQSGPVYISKSVSDLLPLMFTSKSL